MVTMGTAVLYLASSFPRYSPLLQRGLGLEASDLCGMDSVPTGAKAGWDTDKVKGRPHVHKISRAADFTKSNRFAHKPINIVALHGLIMT